MGRDGRGTPGRYVPKDHNPKLRLADLLRRRRTTLTAFVAELGFTTHAALEIWCKRMGVTAPTHDEFITAIPRAEQVNSAQEGVVVLEAPPVLDEASGELIDPDAPAFPGLEVVTGAAAEEAPEATQKKTRKKKESQPTET
jgi:hypothetical protein